MNTNHRYPLRGQGETCTKGGNMLQRRTRQMPSKVSDKNSIQPYEKKSRRDLDSTYQASQISSEMPLSTNMMKNQKALQKTNPRMANMNPRQGKQQMKQQIQMQNQQQAATNMYAPQSQVANMAYQMPVANPVPYYGMPGQMPQMQPMMQVQPQMHMMNAMQPVNPMTFTNEMAALQNQIAFLTQQVHMKFQQANVMQHQQIPGIQQPQFNYTPNMAQGGAPQPEPEIYAEDQNEEGEQIEVNQLIQTPTKRKQSPERKASDSPKREAQNVNHKANPRASQQVKDNSNQQQRTKPSGVQGQKRASVQAKDQDSSKKQKNGHGSPQKSSPVKGQRLNRDLKQLKSALNYEQVDDTLSNKRSTRSKVQAQTQKQAPKTVSSQQKNARSAATTQKNVVTPKQKSPSRSSKSPSRSRSRSMSDSRSRSPPKGSSAAQPQKQSLSPRRQQITNGTRVTRSNAQLPRYPVRETRTSTRLNSAQLQLKESRVAEIQRKYEEKSRILKTLQSDYETETQVQQSQDVKKTTKKPTQDELMLFGSQLSVKQSKDGVVDPVSDCINTHESLDNPLLKNKKREAQTQIVQHMQTEKEKSNDLMVNMKDNLTSQHDVFTDEEDEDQELLDQVQNERNQMKKKQETIEILSENKLKDMGLLFGMPDEEVQKIAEEQKLKLKQIRDQNLLFGEQTTEPKAQEEKVEVVVQPKVEYEEDILVANSQEIQVIKKEHFVAESMNQSNVQVEVREVSASQNSNLNKQVVTDAYQQDHLQLFGEPPSTDQNQKLSPHHSQNRDNTIPKEDAPASIEDPLEGDNTRSFDLDVYNQNSNSINKMNQMKDEQAVAQVVQPAPIEEDVQMVTEKEDAQALQMQTDYDKQKEDLDRQIAEIKKQIQMQEERQQAMINNNQAEMQEVTPVAEAKVDVVQPEMEVVTPPMPVVEKKVVSQPTVENIEIRHEQPSYSNNSASQELVAPRVLPDKLQLPKRYDDLLQFQSFIDCSMNILYTRQEAFTYTNIRKMVEDQSKREFTVEHFRQMLQIEPDLYHHKWERKFGKMDLVLTIPQNMEEILRAKKEGTPYDKSPMSHQGHVMGQIQKRRAAMFQQGLLRAVYKQFKAFKKENNRVSSGEIFKHQRWPQAFDLENRSHVADVPFAQLKEQPVQQKRESVQQFIDQHDTKKFTQQLIENEMRNSTPMDNALMKDESEHQEVQNEDDEDMDEDDDQNSDSSLEAQKRGEKFEMQTGISKATMDAIQLKQKCDQEAKDESQAYMKTHEVHRKIEDLFKVSQQVKQIFELDVSSTLFMARMIDNMMDTHRGQFVSKEHLKDQICLLVTICPGWLSIKQHQHGTLVRCHKNLNIQGYEIKEKIQAYFRNGEKAAEPKQRLSTSCPPAITPEQQTIKPQSVSNRSNSNGPSYSQNNTGSIQKPQSAFQAFGNQQQNSRSQNMANSVSSHKSTGGVIPRVPVAQRHQQPFNNMSASSGSGTGTFLSGPSAISGEAQHRQGHHQIANDTQQPNHMPSNFLSPLKKGYGPPSNPTVGNQQTAFQLFGYGPQVGNDLYQGMQPSMASRSRGSSYNNQQQDFIGNYQNQGPWGR